MEGGSGVVHGQQGDDEAKNGVVGSGALMVSREGDYRRGNWTVPETMVLIEAKRKVHEERHPGDHGLARWRWVEDYCWRAGCRRSQNQCNDRWDNLMRDYKKVRAYELAAGEPPSYWAMGRAERKERGLPSNLLREVYDAMTEVVDRKKMDCSKGASFLGASSSSGLLLDVVPVQASPLAQVLPQPMPLEQVVTRGGGYGVPHYCSSESPERKRRRPSLDERPPAPPESSSTPASAGAHHFHRRQEHGHHGRHEDDDHSDEMSSDEEEEEEEAVLSGAIGRCAAILSEALESREAAEERRHREVMAAEERRGRAVQARREAGEQCVSGLATAVNQLAGSMLALAAAKRKKGGPGPGPGPAAPK